MDKATAATTMTASLEQAIKQVKQLSKEGEASLAEILILFQIAIALLALLFRSNFFKLQRKLQESSSVLLALLFKLQRKSKESPSNEQAASIEGQEDEEEESFWRDGFPLPYGTNVLFSKKIEVKISDLPDWEPNITIESYRFEDDDE